MAQPEEALERGGSRMTDFFRIVVAVAVAVTTVAFVIQAGVVI